MSREISSALPRWAAGFVNFTAEFVKFCRGKLWSLIIRTRQRNWMGHIMTGDSLQREIIEGRMDCKWGRRRPREKNYWTGWWARNTANLKKKLNIEKIETIGGLDLPEGRELKEVIENSKNNYAATMVSAARRQIIGGGGGAPINKSRRRRRPQIVGGAAPNDLMT